MEHFFELLRAHFQQQGYFTITGALLLEYAGLPLPGEAVLLIASFVAASSDGALRLPWIIAVATLACVLGDHVGYVLGRRRGQALLDRWKRIFQIKPRNMERGERLFARFGSSAVFFSRFVFGMRILSGPMAGVLGISWLAFAFFNLLGSLVWVTLVSSVGFFMGRHSEMLLPIAKQPAFLLIAFLLFVAIWWRRFIQKTLHKKGQIHP